MTTFEVPVPNQREAATCAARLHWIRKADRPMMGLKTSAAMVDTLPIARLARRMLAEYGRGQIYEWIHAHLLCKPVFDVDGKATETTAEALLAAALAGLVTFFGGEMPKGVILAASHGGEKLSYRIFVPGYRMRLGLDGRSGGPFDPAIYSTNQKLRMPGSIKTPQDTRVLKLIDDQGDDVEPMLELLQATIVQAVEDEWPLLEEADNVVAVRPRADIEAVDGAGPPEQPPRKRGRPCKKESIPEGHIAILRDMGFRNPRWTGTGPKGYWFTVDNRDAEHPCPNCTCVHESCKWAFIDDPTDDVYKVKNFSARCKTKTRPKDTAQGAVEAIIPACNDFASAVAALSLDDEQSSKLLNTAHQCVVTVACTRPDCTACTRTHDSQLYDCTQIVPSQCWTVRNRDNSCPGRVFHHSNQLEGHLGPMVEGDIDNVRLAQFFLLGNEATLHYNAEIRDVYRWQSAGKLHGPSSRVFRWKKLTRESFQTFVSLWFSRAFFGIKQLPEFKKSAAKISKILARLDSHISHILVNIRGMLTEKCDGRVMDGNPYLLGTDNGVVNLKAVDPDTGRFTTLLRDALPEDLVTRSVGYSTPKGGLQDTDMAAAVEAVFAQIYPVEEERRFFQLYGGYCLLGNHHAKGFMCLTDRRKGDNGKSTAVQLLHRALGEDYVIDNKQNLLYATTVNAHDSGMMAFEGKRLAIMEELSANRTLDTSMLEQISGGTTHVAVCPAGAHETRSMLWSAKLITVFNEGCTPKFKVEDDAFTKRMIVMPHRSFFCKDDAARLAHAGKPHTFDADGAKIEACTSSTAPGGSGGHVSRSCCRSGHSAFLPHLTWYR